METGQGSGFVVDSKGVVITNAHVVKGAQKVKVCLTDGVRYSGTVLGSDEVLDVAVIQIRELKGNTLPCVKLGVSGTLQVGQWVISMGNPLGLNVSATLGIVSSLNPNSTESGLDWTKLELIQTQGGPRPGK